MKKSDKGEFLYKPDWKGRGFYPEDRIIKVGDILAIDETTDKSDSNYNYDINWNHNYDFNWNPIASTRGDKPHKNQYGGVVNHRGYCNIYQEIYGLLHLDKNRDLQKYPLENTRGARRQNN